MVPEAALAAFDGDQIIGTFGTFFFDLTVPGGQAPTAGTTVVTVQPTHRRQGVLTEMMAKHLGDMRERGLPLAALRASEYGIYRRFGYGPATDSAVFKFDRKLVTFPEGPSDVTVRLIDTEQAFEVLPTIYDMVRVRVPGLYSRSETWWRNRVLADPESRRGGASKLRHVVAERQGVVVGYASYRQKAHWESWRAEGEITISAEFSLDSGARKALWSYLTHIDLFPNITLMAAPVDHPMLWETSQPRYIGRTVTDALWIRILDVVAALEGRIYQGSGSLTLQVDDPYLPETGGTFTLTVENGMASVARSDSSPDVVLGIADLGTLYMGGRRVSTLVELDRVVGSTDSLNLLNSLFHSPVTPFSPEVF